jgi:hypothetical protein
MATTRTARSLAAALGWDVERVLAVARRLEAMGLGKVEADGTVHIASVGELMAVIAKRR